MPTAGTNVQVGAMPRLSERVRRRVRRSQAASAVLAMLATGIGRLLPGARGDLRAGRFAVAMGEHRRAVGALYRAVDREAGQAGWLRELATSAERVGDRPTAAWAWLEAARCRRGGRAGSDARRATDHLRALRCFEVAREPLEDLARRHPDDLDLKRTQARLLADQLRWGGSVVGDLRVPGRMSFSPLPVEEPSSVGPSTPAAPELRARLIELLEDVVAAIPDKPAWRVRLAVAREAAGDLPGAIEHLEHAVAQARTADGRWAWRRLHAWEFALERCHTANGTPRVEDPLFAISLGGRESVPPTDPTTTDPVGVYTVEVMHEGVRFHGWTRRPSVDVVEVWHDDRLLRRVNVGGEETVRGFAFTLRRPTVAALPKHGSFHLRTPGEGTWLAFSRYEQVDATVLHGDGRITEVLEAGGEIDKKGTLVAAGASTTDVQRQLLDLYAEVREHFDTRLDRSLLVLYGTLLGVYRDRALIRGDDDFDVGYVSRHSDPAEVKEEAKGFIRSLLAAGFLVTLNHRGRPFRVQRPGAAHGLHLDVQAIWFQDGHAWLHNFTRLPATPEDFVPPVTRTLEGVELHLPKETEHFLAGHYGPGWWTPDPGFKYHVPRLSSRWHRMLDDLHLTPREYRAWLCEFVDDGIVDPTAPTFVALGGQHLYPLDRFVD